MKRFGTTLALAASLLVAQFCLAADLKLPAEVKGEPGSFVRVQADTTGKAVSWKAVDPGLNVFPVDLLKDSKTAVVTAGKPGRYRLWAVTAEGDVPSPIAECVVVIGDAPPTPPVPQPPNPPTPGGAVARVLVVYESADLPKLPAAQQAVIYGKAVRDRLDALTPLGPDGKTHEWRMWDKDTDASAEVPAWGQLLRRERKSLPWVVIASDAGPLYEGPLPANAADMAELLDRYTKKGK